VNRQAGGGPRGHVLIIVQNLPVPLDRRVWMECRSLVAAGVDVSVICPKGPNDTRFEELEGVRIHRYRPAPQTTGALSYVVEFAYSWLVTAWLALRVWRRRRFDVIQACNPPDTFWALALLFRPFGVRFVYDQHDLCPEVFISRFGQMKGLALRGLRGLETGSYRTAAHVITVNESYREVALTRGRLASDRVTVVRSGPQPDRMRRGASVDALKNGRSHLCCYLGVMGPQDGVDLLIRAVDVLVNEEGRTDCHFALLGFGDCLDELQQLATDLGLDDWITFTGRADDVMIGEYLSTASLGLDPDPKNPLNDVSTMNKVLEYMAYELPVVTFDLKETRRSAEHAAYYVEPNDVRGFAAAIDRLLDDPERREKMGQIAASSGG
jgi:glycosyltransferase involved in cell wall biosynthesis